MSLQPSTPPNTKPAYAPTPEQLTRANALNRFNWMYLYVPVTLLGLTVLTLTVLMLYTVFSRSPEDPSYSFFSGLADLILIFYVILPSMLLCAIGPAAAGFLIYRATERRKLPPAERRSKIQTLLWRVDSLINQIQARLRDSYLDQAVRPLIKAHALTAALQSLAQFIRNLLRRER